METRFQNLHNKFAEKCLGNEKTKDIFPENSKVTGSRKTERFTVFRAKHQRTARGAVQTMTKYLNTKYFI